MAIPSGLLNDIIRVELAIITQSPQDGEDLKTWTGVTGLTQLPSDFQYIGSREFPETWKTYAETNARCRVRKTPATSAIDPATHRIVFDSKNWDILGVILDSDRTVLTLELANRK